MGGWSSVSERASGARSERAEARSGKTSEPALSDTEAAFGQRVIESDLVLRVNYHRKSVFRSWMRIRERKGSETGRAREATAPCGEAAIVPRLPAPCTGRCRKTHTQEIVSCHSRRGWRVAQRVPEIPSCVNVRV